MVSVDVLLGYAALAFCAWRFLRAAANAMTIAPHALPAAPKGVHPPPSRVDALRCFFVTSHGLALYVHKWLPRFDCAPKGVFFILHGLGEYGGRYDHVGCVLARRGFVVFMVDHQGHGRSDGERMYVQKVKHLAEDAMEFVRHVLNGPQPGDKNAAVVDAELDAHADVNWTNLPRFVLGHSMGGVLVLQLMEQSIEQNLHWNGVIVSSAPFWTVPGGGVAGFVKVLAWLFPRLQIPAFKFTKLGNDPEVFNRWIRDELMPKHGATFQVTSDLLCEGDRFAKSDNELAKTFPAPIYLLYGQQDTLTFAEGTVNFFNACALKDKTINVVPDAVHDVLNLEGNEKILENIVNWMETRLK